MAWTTWNSPASFGFRARLFTWQREFIDQTYLQSLFWDGVSWWLLFLKNIALGWWMVKLTLCHGKYFTQNALLSLPTLVFLSPSNIKALNCTNDSEDMNYILHSHWMPVHQLCPCHAGCDYNWGPPSCSWALLAASFTYPQSHCYITKSVWLHNSGAVVTMKGADLYIHL